MGNSTTNLGLDVSGTNAKLFQVSYTDQTDYSNYVNQGLYNHVFNSDSLFPDLSEYAKLTIVSGLDRNDLFFSQEALATLKIIETGGSFKNVLGYYKVDLDGTIHDISIAFKNTREAETGLSHAFNIGGKGESINFFMIANGYALNKEFSNLDDDGSFSFIYNKGEEDERLAQITDSADDIMLVYQAGDGEVSTIRGPVYHSTETESGSQINSDGDVHVVSGIVDYSENEALRIGFEDFPGLGDADYNDIVFDLSVSYLNPDYNPNGKTADFLSNIEPAAQSFSEEDDKQEDGGAFPGVNNFFGEPDSNEDIVPNDGEESDVIIVTEDSININDVISNLEHVDEYVAGYMNTSSTYGEDLFSLQSESSPIGHAIENIIDLSSNNLLNIEVII